MTPLRWLLLAGAVALAAPAQAPVPPGTHPVTGRRIAPVMSHLGADWLDRPEREREEDPALAVRLLGLDAGQVVADLGAGSGYMTVKLARQVGPRGRVYAVDVQPEMIALIERRIRAEGLTNVVPVLGAPDEPRLPDGAIDLVLMVDVYHELAEPQRVLERLRRALAPGGRVVLLEYRKEDPSIPIREEHKMTVDEARAELEAAGYQLARVNEDLPRQHLLVFTVRGGAGAGG
jgi:SAM-dependent methyltransferase